LNGFFRKALMTNKAVLYEDTNIQIGLVADYSNIQLIRMRLFFGNKSGPTLSHISFKPTPPLIPLTAMQVGYQIAQSRTDIPSL
jgi:hypothetical protein